MPAAGFSMQNMLHVPVLLAGRLLLWLWLCSHIAAAVIA